jgi:hypothetical protein
MGYLDSPNSVTFITLSFGFLSMSLGTILACCFKMKCSQIDMCSCFKLTRNVELENINAEVGIDGNRNRNDGHIIV